MDVTPLVPEGRQVVEGYGDGRFRVSGTLWRGPVIVFPDRTVAWPGGSMSGLSLAMLEPALAVDEVPEILLLGCGARAGFVSPALRAAIRSAGPVLESMGTGAACRTYNVLLSEGRRIAAALIPVD